MLHKHPSAEKAQHYFGISEKVKHDAANFFIYIQPKFGNIYDTSILRALDAEFMLILSEINISLTLQRF